MNINCHHISRSQAIELHEAGFEVEAAPKSSPKNFLPIRLIGESVLHHDGELDGELYRVFGNISAGFRKIISAAEARRRLQLGHPHVYHCMRNVEVWKSFNRYADSNILNDPMMLFSTFEPFKPSEPKPNEVPQGEVDLLKAALVRCITIIQYSHGIATETEEWASSSDAMKRILAIDAVAGAKKALHGIPH